MQQASTAIVLLQQMFMVGSTAGISAINFMCHVGTVKKGGPPNTTLCATDIVGNVLADVTGLLPNKRGIKAEKHTCKTTIDPDGRTAHYSCEGCNWSGCHPGIGCCCRGSNCNHKTHGELVRLLIHTTTNAANTTSTEKPESDHHNHHERQIAVVGVAIDVITKLGPKLFKKLKNIFNNFKCHTGTAGKGEGAPDLDSCKTLFDRITQTKDSKPKCKAEIDRIGGTAHYSCADCDWSGCRMDKGACCCDKDGCNDHAHDDLVRELVPTTTTTTENAAVTMASTPAIILLLLVTFVVRHNVNY